VVAPAATVIVAGTLSRLLLLDSVTVDPPAGAAGDNVTVQVLTPDCPRLAGVQDREEMFGTVMTPPTGGETFSEFPLASVATGFDIAIVVVVAVVAIVTTTLAMTPAAIVLVFNPVTIQVTEPVTDEQATDFPAAVAAGPVVIEIAEIWPAG
jgi:hypothetical protein